MKVKLDGKIGEAYHSYFAQNKLFKYLQSIDMYGHTMNFAIEDKADSIKTPFGGCMTMLFVCLTLTYLTVEFAKIY